MARPKKAEVQGSTEERLLQAAEDVFSEKGYSNTTLREVSEKAGIKAPSLLYYFSTKEQLYAAVIGRAYDHIACMLNYHAIHTDENMQWVLAFFADLMRFEQERHALFQVFVEGLFSSQHLGSDELQAQLAPLMERFEVLIRESTKPPLPRKAPVRQVFLQIFVSYAARSALGSSGDKLWGSDTDTLEIALKLMENLRNWS